MPECLCPAPDRIPYFCVVGSKSYTISEIREKMAAYCAYQDRCYLEVERKLDTFGLIPEAKDDILLYLMRENFVNEERFAKSFARGKFYLKKWGKIKIRTELKKRQISPRNIDTAMQEIDENDYLLMAQKLIDTKSALLSGPENYRKKQKIIRYMMQKGYEYPLLHELLNTD